MSTLTAQDFTHNSMIFLRPDQSVFEAYSVMQKDQIRHLPVVENGEAVGIISDRDLQFIQEYASDRNLTCASIMTREPYVVTPQTPVKEMAKIMLDKKISSLLIRNEQGKLVGIFTTTDALKIVHEQI